MKGSATENGVLLGAQIGTEDREEAGCDLRIQG